MEALIKMVADKTGISQDQAAIAVNTVVGFLKVKMPAGHGEHLAYLVNDKDGGAAGGFGDIAGKLGDNFKK